MIGSHVSQLKWYIKKTHHSAWNKIDRNKNDFFMIFFSNPLGVLYPRYFYSSISPFIEPQMIVTWKRSIKIRKKTLDMISDVKASSELTLGFFFSGCRVAVNHLETDLETRLTRFWRLFAPVTESQHSNNV